MYSTQKEPSPWLLAVEADCELVHGTVLGNCFNSLWVYFQGNLEQQNLEFNLICINVFNPLGGVFGPSVSPLSPYLQAPDLVKGRLLVCFLCLGHLVLSLPIQCSHS